MVLGGRDECGEAGREDWIKVWEGREGELGGKEGR